MSYPFYLSVVLLIIAGVVIYFQHRRISDFKKKAASDFTYAAGLKAGREQEDFRVKLVSVLAHDFRGVFMNIISLMDLYKKGEVPPERLNALFSELKTTSQNSLAAFENTLKWVKTQFNGYTYKPLEINMPDAIRETISNNISEIKRKKISLSIIDEEEDRIVHADSQLLGFILNNLFNNAVKYSYPGGVVECVIGKGPGKVVKVQIIDHGIGMDARTRDTIFCYDKTIYTGTDGEKGAGIALLICKDFVEIQQGTLDIVSEAGKGSVFTLSIPCATGNAADVFCDSESGSFCF